MKHIIWNGIGYDSMRECARLVGLTASSIQWYYNKGFRSNAEIQAFRDRRKCVVCNGSIPKGRIRYCSSNCYRQAMKPATRVKKRKYPKLPPSKINILMSLDDNGGLPRDLGSSKTVQLMAQDGYIIEVGNGYYVMTQFGIEMLDAYLGGD